MQGKIQYLLPYALGLVPYALYYLMCGQEFRSQNKCNEFKKLKGLRFIYV